MLFDVEKTLAGIPHDPGVYLMKDARDQIIYIGKAKDLHKRVRRLADRVHELETRESVNSLVLASSTALVPRRLQ